MQSVRRFGLVSPRSPLGRIALVGGIVAGLALTGAFGFGLVHIVGGAIRGNDRAVLFGVRLSLATGVLLAAGIVAVLRSAFIRRSDT